jgi:peptide subunit release factor 1 (eRF1)
MNVVEEKEIVDELVEQAVKAGATVEYVSVNTPEGRQFREIGGIAAFLRYKLS